MVLREKRTLEVFLLLGSYWGSWAFSSEPDAPQVFCHNTLFKLLGVLAWLNVVCGGPGGGCQFLLSSLTSHKRGSKGDATTVTSASWVLFSQGW